MAAPPVHGKLELHIDGVAERVKAGAVGGRDMQSELAVFAQRESNLMPVV